ncbi:propanol-preferring alcohol dehydrogenase [Actinoplanes campanulatus]|uniref:Alcohol dehydrogenase n=1 Tax=Actinoplanes campanulatus TaxID=113559 RepID=A0A7W5ASB8_9ACTN|nr:zinc-dependent alcohol dehydrogenase [Actinoplanes campanulatus]MBB3101503.1 propanol-preferring alcohol dehydrogenase [Actinoplanes campanulatus]GGN50548.1 zinc-dependent alcohol dehydrogenase [Actinoplanes campanulatus]GID42099.1 zinc-dependent alcohol dehydrogenase [Actinoplanes campanulatus]
MRAAVVTAFDKPLEIREVAVPEPRPGQIRVRLEASGLCHTDIHAARGDWPVKPALPFTPGHEGVGVVDKAGEGVAVPAAGERVAIPWLGHACGTCEYCVTGWETLCEAQLNTGYAIDGGHAEYLVADAKYVVRVPDGISPAEAAPLTCAGVTTYKAVKVGGVTPGNRVAIFGIGGLGHLAQQYAQIFGGETIGVDVTEEKLELSRRLGAAHVVNAAKTDPVAAIEALGGADVAVVLAADPRVIEQAHASLRRGGRLILVSLPKDNAISLPVFQTVLKGIRVIGSIVGTRADLAEVFRLHAAGRTEVLYETRTLGAINDSIEDVLDSRVPARLVLIP